MLIGIDWGGTKIEGVAMERLVTGASCARQHRAMTMKVA
jgi:hypothetical protein